MIVDSLEGVPVNVSAQLIMNLVRPICLSCLHPSLMATLIVALWIRTQQLLPRRAYHRRVHPCFCSECDWRCYLPSARATIVLTVADGFALNFRVCNTFTPPSPTSAFSLNYLLPLGLFLSNSSQVFLVSWPTLHFLRPSCHSHDLLPSTQVCMLLAGLDLLGYIGFLHMKQYIPVANMSVRQS
jgi:hypothetical protein